MARRSERVGRAGAARPHRLPSLAPVATSPASATAQLGNRLTVDPRTLTPLVLVRIQVPQPATPASLRLQGVRSSPRGLHSGPARLVHMPGSRGMVWAASRTLPGGEPSTTGDRGFAFAPRVLMTPPTGRWPAAFWCRRVLKRFANGRRDGSARRCPRSRRPRPNSASVERATHVRDGRSQRPPIPSGLNLLRAILGRPELRKTLASRWIRFPEADHGASGWVGLPSYAPGAGTVTGIPVLGSAGGSCGTVTRVVASFRAASAH